MNSRSGETPELRKKHPLAIRWFHWLNFPILALMVWSGLLIYWANGVYSIGPIHFFPDWFYRSTGIVNRGPDGGYYGRLAEGMAWHFFFMWFFAINGLLYVLYTTFSGQWRYLLPGKRSWKEALQVVLYDLHLSKKHPPKKKFNGAQQITYTGIIIMGFLSLLTGLAIYKPVQAGWLTTMLGGYDLARIEHFALTIGYVLFFIIHIIQVVRAGWNNFRSMLTGYELEPAKETANG